MPFVLDEASYRIDKNSFPTAEEAEQRAGEAARILGRAVNVYELIGGELLFAFRVMPDGAVERENPLDDPMPGTEIKPASPAVLGSVLDQIDVLADDAELNGQLGLSTSLDHLHSRIEAGDHEGVKEIARKIKEEAPMFNLPEFETEPGRS